MKKTKNLKIKSLNFNNHNQAESKNKKRSLSANNLVENIDIKNNKNIKNLKGTSKVLEEKVNTCHASLDNENTKTISVNYKEKKCDEQNITKVLQLALGRSKNSKKINEDEDKENNKRLSNVILPKERKENKYNNNEKFYEKFSKNNTKYIPSVFHNANPQNLEEYLPDIKKYLLQLEVNKLLIKESQCSKFTLHIQCH